LLDEGAAMPSEDDFKRLETEFLGLARRIFDAGIKAERDRVVAFLQGKSVFAADAHLAHPPRRIRTERTGYGAVSGPVRDALTELAAESPEGVGAREIAEHFARLGSGPDERQVRAALKTLTITGEAIRASRGRYLPGATASPPPEEKPGDDTPGSADPFESMAAE
jgi:hypothetical protein